MTSTESERPNSHASKLTAANGFLGVGKLKYSYDMYYTKHLVYPPRNKNPSLAMRLRDLEFQTSKECVFMGRGYIKRESVKDGYVMTGGSFTCKSKDWDDELLNIHKCSVCGSTTPDKLKDSCQIYCSDDCAVESYARKNGSAEKSVFDMFRPGETGTVEIRKEVLDGRAPCSVILQSQRSLYEQLNAFSKTTEELSRAEKGDYVLVEDEGKGFLRGLVVNVDSSNYKVGLIDRSEIVDVSKVYTTTESLEKKISFGGVITFMGNESPQSNLIQFRARERGPFGIWLCDVLESNKNDDLTEITLEEWSPPLKIDTIPLESGCNVVITQYLDAKTMYVKRIDSPWNEECIRYNNDIAAYCVEAKEYKRIPNKGEICCARYEKDGSYYRGVVRGFEKSLVVIKFLDYGTEQLTKVSDLRYLPALAKQVISFSRLVKLKDVKLDSTPEAIHYLNRMTAYGCELVVTFEGDRSDEVLLIDKYSGEILNNVISNYEIPTWVKSRHAFSKSGEIYDYTTMHEVSFTCGAMEDVFVLDFDETSFRNQGIFWGTVNRRDYLGHLNGELKKRMAEFCGHMVNDRYLPRIGELCIAMYKDEWSRALCVEDKDVICRLTFIDHGTSLWVETKNIRKILKEFLEMPALALKCAVADTMWSRFWESWLPEMKSGFLARILREKILMQIRSIVSNNSETKYPSTKSTASFLVGWKRSCALSELLKRGTTINSDPYCNHLDELKAVIEGKRPALAYIQEMKNSEKEELVAYVKRSTQKAIPRVKILKRLGEVYYMAITVPTEFGDGEVGAENSSFDGLSKNVVAVTVTCPGGDITASDAIVTIKTNIDFEMLGIVAKFLKASTNLLILQIEGENCREDAKVLVEELVSLFPDKAVQIGCLAGGKVKLSGFTASVKKEEIIEKVAEIADIQKDEIQVNTFVHSGGTTVAWVRCPLVAAINLAVMGTISLESCTVKVELQHRRPVRCFRCLREGHVGAQCYSKEVESKCFRCSETGHKAVDCSKRPFCELCSERGYPSTHRIGSGSCKSREDNVNELELENENN